MVAGTMAVWRTKAYLTFDVTPGSYSYAVGKLGLMTDMVEWVRAAVDDGDNVQIRKIVDYVVWAAGQNSDELASVVDLAFFLPIFRDTPLSAQLMPHFPPELVAEKRRILMEEPA